MERDFTPLMKLSHKQILILRTSTILIFFVGINKLEKRYKKVFIAQRRLCIEIKSSFVKKKLCFILKVKDLLAHPRKKTKASNCSAIPTI
uniref:Uncharacterized protein n=1 Tax=Lepeophtheirus salmonis TaxID=72036 RepID=A0A0K2V719_LEPSM